MKCPRCGSEMQLDSHRKIDLMMCYQCGYIEGRRIEGEEATHSAKNSNLRHLESLNMNEAIEFLADGLGLDRNKVEDWLDEEYKG